jgi:hypothetical protein
MRAVEMPFALFAFFAIVAVVPVWMWFVDNYTAGLHLEEQFLATFSLPVLLLFFLAGWLEASGG